jgi:CRISPR/Cas system CSM-associated protein Csm2 small subunit
MFLESFKNNLKTTIKQKSESKRDEFGNFGNFFEVIH